MHVARARIWPIVEGMLNMNQVPSDWGYVVRLRTLMAQLESSVNSSAAYTGEAIAHAATVVAATNLLQSVL